MSKTTTKTKPRNKTGAKPKPKTRSTVATRAGSGIETGPLQKMGERLLLLISDCARNCREEELATPGCCTYTDSQGHVVCKDTDRSTCLAIPGSWSPGLCTTPQGHGLPEFDEADIKRMVSILNKLNRKKYHPQPEGTGYFRLNGRQVSIRTNLLVCVVGLQGRFVPSKSSSVQPDTNHRPAKSY
jgi:hypothetical protein